MKKISASFLSSMDVERDLTILNETDVDFIHVDVMDGKFVHNKTMPFRMMKNIYKFTSKRLDVHLMVEKPLKLIKKYASLNTEYIAIHCEIEEDIPYLLDTIESYGIKKGLSINPDTSIEKIIPYLDQIDLILVMSVHPGEGGQEFIKETTSKIDALKKIIKEKKLSTLISVDGGINDKTSKEVKNADILVSGSYIVNSDNFQERINILRGKKNGRKK